MGRRPAPWTLFPSRPLPLPFLLLLLVPIAFGGAEPEITRVFQSGLQPALFPSDQLLREGSILVHTQPRCGQPALFLPPLVIELVQGMLPWQLDEGRVLLGERRGLRWFLLRLFHLGAWRFLLRLLRLLAKQDGCDLLFDRHGMTPPFHVAAHCTIIIAGPGPVGKKQSERPFVRACLKITSESVLYIK